MKLSILSRSPEAFSTKRLVDEAKRRGHHVTVMDTMQFAIGLRHGDPQLFYRSKKMGIYDAVIPRIGASITFFGLAVLRQFEQLGVYCANDSIGIARSRDKLRSMQIFSRHDIGIPPTAFARSKADVIPAIERVGGAPVIIKVLEGTQGVGVILAETTKIAEAIIETLQSARQNVLIQKFISESRGRDLRAIVVGDRVVGAMRRLASSGDEYRSNVHRGGRTESVTLEPEYERTAIRAAQIIGLRVAGVDMLESASGPQVMEVNSSPGLEGIEGATRTNIAGAIIEDIEQRVLFPDVDLKQRLRIAGGYGIVEFTVHDMPSLEGKALRDTDLSANTIHVMYISRHDEVIPNPHGDTVVQTGDQLLCFGELGQLRALAAEHGTPREQEKRLKKKKKASKSDSSRPA